MQDHASTGSLHTDQRPNDPVDVLLLTATDPELDPEAGERLTRRWGFTAPVDTLRDWLGRSSSAPRRISLTIDGDTLEPERASVDERRELIEVYARPHTGG